MRYRIGDFAALSGVSAKALRFYDRIGLFRPAAVDARTGYRLYRAEQLPELAAIIALKELGASLSQIQRAALRDVSARGRRVLLEKLRGDVERSIEDRRQALARIDAALAETRCGGCPASIVIKRSPPILIASIRAEVKDYPEIAQYESKLAGATPEDVRGTLQGTLWHSCADSGRLEGEPFVELRRRVSRSGACEVKELPAVSLACVYSSPNDEDAEDAYDALRRWMHSRGYRLAGPKRELSFRNLLEIQFPLAS